MSGSKGTTGDASPAANGSAKGAVTIVTQTRVRPESMDAFARWQDETSGAVAQFPGFRGALGRQYGPPKSAVEEAQMRPSRRELWVDFDRLAE